MTIHQVAAIVVQLRGWKEELLVRKVHVICFDLIRRVDIDLLCRWVIGLHMGQRSHLGLYRGLGLHLSHLVMRLHLLKRTPISRCIGLRLGANARASKDIITTNKATGIGTDSWSLADKSASDIPRGAQGRMIVRISNICTLHE